MFGELPQFTESPEKPSPAILDLTTVALSCLYSIGSTLYKSTCFSQASFRSFCPPRSLPCVPQGGVLRRTPQEAQGPCLKEKLIPNYAEVDKTSQNDVDWTLKGDSKSTLA